MTDVTPIAERQLVGLCLRYAEAVEQTDSLSGEDFTTPWLGRLFEACRLIPPAPEKPGPFPRLDPAEWATTPMPAEWAAWLEQAADWRPRQAARLVMVHPDQAIELHDGCSVFGTLDRWLTEVSTRALHEKYRMACQYALELINQGAEPAAVKAILSEPESIKAVLSGMV